jgi:hypothetical protein
MALIIIEHNHWLECELSALGVKEQVGELCSTVWSLNLSKNQSGKVERSLRCSNGVREEKSFLVEYNEVCSKSYSWRGKCGRYILFYPTVRFKSW